jgi:hypothetical protein
MKRVRAGLLACGMLLWPQAASAQQALVVKKLAEKTISASALPAGPVVRRIENFATLEAAQAAAGPTSVATRAAGRVWLFTLGPPGGTSPGGTTVAEVGPVQRCAAAEFSSPAAFP